LLLGEIVILREAFRATRSRRTFDIDASIVLPDHMQPVGTLPEDEASFSDRWGAIKARFSKAVRSKYVDSKVGYKPTLHRMARAGDAETTGCWVGFNPPHWDTWLVRKVGLLPSLRKLPPRL
jgi:putative transposase